MKTNLALAKQMHAAQNYIYIIFAVAYAIYSMVKAGKKVTQNRPTLSLPDRQAGPNPSPSGEGSSASQKREDSYAPTVQPPTATPLPQQDYKKMLEDLFGVPKANAPVSQQPVAKERTDDPKRQPVKISLNTPQKEKTETAREKLMAAHSKSASEKLSHVKQPKAIKKVFAEATVEEETIADFDIRQAVIYSEILKRPEY